MDCSNLNIDSGNIIKKILLILGLLVLLIPMNLYSQNGLSTYKLNALNIVGNNSYSNGAIKKNLNITKNRWFFMRRRLSKRMIISDRLIIKTFYLKNGYLDANVRDSISIHKNQKVDVFFFINEGEKYILENIIFSGNTIFTDSELLKHGRLRKGKAYNPILAREMIRNIKNKYENKGKPLIEITDSLHVNGNMILLHCKINENKTFTINNIFLKNNKHVQDRVILRELSFMHGNIYSKKNINKSKKYLLNLGLFSTVNINYTNIDTINNNIDLTVYTRETDRRYWEWNTGYIEKEGLGTEKTQFWEIAARWRNKNINNRAHGFGIYADYGLNLDDIKLNPDFNAEINYSIPWLFRFRSTSLLRLFLEDKEQEEYEFRKYGFETSFIVNPDKRNYLKTGFEFSGIINKFEEIDTTVIKEIEKEKEQSVFINYTRDRRNDFMYPSRGHIFNFKGKITSSVFGGTEDYFQFETSYSEYFLIENFIVFTYQAKLGYLAPYGKDKSAPEYEKYYLGGPNSLRGWETQKFHTKKSPINNEIIADRKNVKVLTNLELRFPLFWQIGGEVFIDGGNLADDAHSLFRKQYHWNYGFGITVATPLGPARVDFAWPATGVNKNKRQIQFAISSAF